MRRKINLNLFFQMFYDEYVASNRKKHIETNAPHHGVFKNIRMYW